MRRTNSSPAARQVTHDVCDRQPGAAATCPSGRTRCLIWETARPYFYARQTDDGRALIGGEDTPFADDHEQAGLLVAKAERLAVRFEPFFPGVHFEPEYRWAGTFAETKDGLPYIGPPPGHERIYFALGYGGNGITFSMIAARLLTDLFSGGRTRRGSVFSFHGSLLPLAFASLSLHRLDSLQRRFGGAGHHFARGLKPRAVAGAVPGLLRVVPAHQAAHVRADGGDGR